MEKITTYDIDFFMKFKDANKELPQKLHEFIERTKKQLKDKDKDTIIWKKTEPRKGNWLMDNKLNQTEDTKVYASMRGILNKININNFDKLIEELMTLNISTSDHLKELANIIFNKSICEQKFNKIYAKLCSKLLPYYIEIENDKVYFRTFLLDKCQELFENYTSQTDPENINSEKVLGCMAFLGELYNCDILTNVILTNCLMILITNTTKKYAYTIESLCKLMLSVGKEFCKKDKHHAVICLKKIEEILKLPDIKIRDKFMVEDLIDKKNKEKWII